jgi:hypothetical protein
MTKKSMLALVVVLMGMALAMPGKANAQVAIGVRVGPVVVASHAFVRPYVVAPAPYVAVAPAYVYPRYAYPVYPAPAVVAGGRWCPRPYLHEAYRNRRFDWRR